jgi:hypothetical protein
MTLTILKTERFQPLGPAIPKPAPAAPQSREIKPGIWQAPDGKLRTDFATGQSVAPAQKAAPVAPLPVPPSTPGFKVGDRVKYNAENIAAMGDCERVIKRIQGDELYFAHPYGWDYADRMIPA